MQSMEGGFVFEMFFGRNNVLFVLRKKSSIGSMLSSMFLYRDGSTDCSQTRAVSTTGM